MDNTGHLVDRVGSLTVDLYVGTLQSVTELEMYSEAMIAAYGNSGRWEIISPQNVTDNMDGTYTLDTFLRGLRGTEWLTGTHEVGDYLVILTDPDNAFVNAQLSDIGSTLIYRGVSNGQDFDAVFNSTIDYAAENLTPLAPVDVVATQVSSDIIFTLHRRDRVNAGWNNYTDIPMSEASLAFELDIYNTAGDTVIRTLTSTTESITYTAAQIATDFGLAPPDITISLYQMSEAVGRGHVFHADLIVDAPPAVESKWNPADTGGGMTFTNANRTASTAGGGWTSCRATASRNNAIRYFEIICNGTGTNMFAGVADAGATMGNYLGNAGGTSKQSAGSWGNATVGNLFININSSSSQSVSGYGATDIIGIRVNFSLKQITWYKNGTLLYTHTEAGALNALFPACSMQNTASCTLNSIGPFAFLPSGAAAWDHP